MHELIGKRVLLSVRQSYGAHHADEFKVLEVSPSGGWVRTMNVNGQKRWMRMSELSLIEVLIPLEPSPEAVL